MTQLLWVLAPPPHRPHGKKFLLMAILNISFQFMSLLSHPSTMHHCQEPVCRLNNLPAVTGGAAVGPPLEAISSPG